jgi:hypothetical protein
MVNTVATDHVGVKANDLASFAFSAILKYQKPQSKPYL